MPQLEKVEFSVKPVPPFRLDLTSWTLRRRQSNMMDLFDGIRYQCAITLANKVIEMSVIQTGSVEKPHLKVAISGNRIGPTELQLARKNLELLLGLKIDLTDFYQSAKHNPRVWELVKGFRGVKPPRFPSIFETLVNAISCQQVSLTVGLLLMNRLAWNYGRAISGETSSIHAFPTAQDLSNLEMDSLRRFGFSTQKSRYIVGLARSVVNEEVDLENLASMNDEDTLNYLQSIPGIGRWSSQYALLRGLGRLHRFPADDVGAQNGLKRLLGLRKRPNYERTIELIEPWQPYAGVMYFHLLLNRLNNEGILTQKLEPTVLKKKKNFEKNGEVRTSV